MQKLQSVSRRFSHLICFCGHLANCRSSAAHIPTRQSRRNARMPLYRHHPMCGVRVKLEEKENNHKFIISEQQRNSRQLRTDKLSYGARALFAIYMNFIIALCIVVVVFCFSCFLCVAYYNHSRACGRTSSALSWRGRYIFFSVSFVCCVKPFFVYAFASLRSALVD